MNQTSTSRGTVRATLARLLSLLALSSLATGIILLALGWLGVWVTGPGLAQLFIEAPAAVAAIVLLGRLARRDPSMNQTTTARRTARTTLARLLSLLALASLAGGSILLALAWLGVGVTGDKGEARVFAMLFLWPPTFLLTWAFGTLAIIATKNFNPYAIIVAFVGGSLGGWFLLLATIGAPAPIGIAVLLGLNLAAITLAWHLVWRVRSA